MLFVLWRRACCPFAAWRTTFARHSEQGAFGGAQQARHIDQNAAGSVEPRMSKLPTNRAALPTFFGSVIYSTSEDKMEVADCASAGPIGRSGKNIIGVQS
jgi:hypothetical protein